MAHALCQCRQENCTDAVTELLRRGFLRDLRQAVSPEPATIDPLRIVLAVTTATSTTTAISWSATS
jgi:hypothetical protein